MSEFATRSEILRALRAYSKMKTTKIRFSIEGVVFSLAVLAATLTVLAPLLGN